MVATLVVGLVFGASGAPATHSRITLDDIDAFLSHVPRRWAHGEHERRTHRLALKVHPSVTLSTTPGPPPKPVVPTEWTAPLALDESGLSLNGGRWNQDTANSRYSYSFSDGTLPGRGARPPVQVPPGTQANYSIAANATAMGESVNGVCRFPSPTARYADLFGWMREYAFYEGDTTVDGRVCQVWASSDDPKTAAAKLCVESNGDPVVLLVQGRASAEMFHFGVPVLRGPPPPEALDIPAECGRPGPTCPNGKAAALEVVVFHPAGKLDIVGQDVADILGDTMFLCLAGPNATSAGQQYSEVSMWQLEVWTGYGQYSLCNGYPSTCIGNDDFNVGCEASASFKPGCGQCTDNTADFGSWFSLGAKGECAAGAVPDGTTCTWRRVHRSKTVSIQCPSFATFFATCATEKELPFTSSSAKLAKIFASDDVQAGGCPALPVP
eukprot:CAMPEP_0182922436 /NCGR_PEP_ID=MMETSP0105_2-20130417/4794_1 /TAXON_ID=81532 ORGANISM="Acanthoeca-like sp., Strain 10tr" /NCGR_SAMPLE_ID=MMETSP0105_2 /ASSEMBLY_ACC=CAM_ASM_000205 /LENGTH=439 /DNA_ID=CAMNT_0025060051 /DNA_START=133 /DNA_END=1452 /DNA_ORIENTATION=+